MTAAACSLPYVCATVALELAPRHQLVRLEVVRQPLDELRRQVADLLDAAPEQVVHQDGHDLVVGLARRPPSGGRPPRARSA